MAPNVLLIVLDSVRYQNTSLSDYYRRTTPFLEELGSDATSYTQVRAPAVWSLPSHVSIFTGEPTSNHMVVSESHALEAGYSVFEALSSAGYRTAVLSDNPYLTDLDTGLARGFDDVVQVDPTPFDGMNPQDFLARNDSGQYLRYVRESLASDHPVGSLLNGVVTKFGEPQLRALDKTYVDRATEWIRERTGDWAACVNLMDAHGPYVGDQDVWSDETLRSLPENNLVEYLTRPEKQWILSAKESLYDDAILNVDAHVRSLVQCLKDTGQYDDTLVIVTADHGEGLGEQSLVRRRPVVKHNADIHEVQTHVPLLVKAPGQREGRTDSSLTSLCRVAEVVADHTLGGDSFTAPDAVEVVSAGVPEMLEQTSSEQYDDNSVLYESGIARYHEVSDSETGTVRKRLRWEGDPMSVVVVDSRNRVSRGVESGVDYPELPTEPRKPEMRGDTDQEYSVDTMQRLEELGYR